VDVLCACVAFLQSSPGQISTRITEGVSLLNLDNHYDFEVAMMFAMKMGRDRALSGKRSMVGARVIIAEFKKDRGFFMYRTGHARAMRAAYGWSFWNIKEQLKKK
jgi:hypothetical protein